MAGIERELTFNISFCDSGVTMSSVEILKV